MSNISNQLIKDSYNYVLQSDLATGNVYRIGGVIPVDPKFLSGLTVFTSLKFSDGSEQNGYVLTSDNSGNASWQPVGAVSDVRVTGFSYTSNTFTIFDNSGNTFNATINNVTGLTINGNLIVTGNTIVNTLTATSVSAATYFGLPLDIYVTGGTYSAGTTTFTNNTGGTFNVTGFSEFHYYISGSSPSGFTLNIGDRWYNTNNGAEYVWNYDGNTYQWVQPAGIPGPQGPQGVDGYSNLMVTTAITISAETLTTGYTYYGIVHSGIVNLTLPNPTGIDGFNLNIKDESGNAGIYRIRLTSPVGNIDNDNYVDMNINKMSLNLVARNNNWWLI